MPSRYLSAHKIRVFIAALIVLLGLVSVGYVFTPYGNPPQCEGLQHPDRGDNCIIGANIGSGLILLFGLMLVWFGAACLLASYAYRAYKIGKKSQMKLLIFITAVVLIAPPLSLSIYTSISESQANEISQ